MKASSLRVSITAHSLRNGLARALTVSAPLWDPVCSKKCFTKEQQASFIVRTTCSRFRLNQVVNLSAKRDSVAT